MAALCMLCDKKMGLFEGVHTPADVLICDNCYTMYENIIDSMNDAEEFKTKLDEFKAIFSNKEKVGILVEHLDSLYNSKLREAKEKEAEKERKRLEELHLRKEEEKQERLNRERIQQQYQIRIDNLNKMGLDGYYEYKVVSLKDDNAGGIYSSTIEEILNNLGLDGWHLKCAYTNELGKNSNSGGIGGFSTGTNSTIDQNILIFERFVRINKE